MNIKWNADKYTQDFSFVHEYGNEVIGLINREEGASVLDLGCGNGALTKKLSELGFKASGLDASPELLQIARKHYPELTFYQGDATEFELPGKVDVIFSNAVLHWIAKDKQPDLLRCVYHALNENGQFVFEFGGSQNNVLTHEGLRQAFAARGLEYKMPFYFPTIGEYASLMERAGFRVEYALLFDRPTELKGDNGLYDWIDLFIRTPFGGVDEGMRKEIIADAVERLRDKLFRDGKWFSDYVRIRGRAVATVKT